MKRFIAVVAAAAFVSGCTGTATLDQRRGPMIEGTIEGSDAKTVTMKGLPSLSHRLAVKRKACKGKTICVQGPHPIDEVQSFTVERSNIESIDHPGTTEMVVGGLIMAGSIPIFLIADDVGSWSPVFVACGVGVLGLGVFGIIDGYLMQQASVEAATADARRSMLLPTVVFDGERALPGVAGGLRF